MITVIALIVGIGGGLLLRPALPAPVTPYVPVVVAAALDVVFEGIRARLEGGYSEGEFIFAFVTNSALAAFVVWVGDRLGTPDLLIGVIVVFGVRIFQSLAAIRHHIFRE